MGETSFNGEAAAQSPGSAAVGSRSRTRQLNGSRPPGAIGRYVVYKTIAATDFVSERCSAFPRALAPFCGPAFSPRLEDQQTNILFSPPLQGDIAVKENTSDTRLFLSVHLSVFTCVSVGACAPMCIRVAGRRQVSCLRCCPPWFLRRKGH